MGYRKSRSVKQVRKLCAKIHKWIQCTEISEGIKIWWRTAVLNEAIGRRQLNIHASEMVRRTRKALKYGKKPNLNHPLFE